MKKMKKDTEIQILRQFIAYNLGHRLLGEGYTLKQVEFLLGELNIKEPTQKEKLVYNLVMSQINKKMKEVK